ncbi:MAG: hypothetical protein HYV65_01065 [Candidatus Spechtbacteria bacterium]|nr:hypothetical protein [Candidatus Spechtbacteria bacterium]
MVIPFEVVPPERLPMAMPVLVVAAPESPPMLSAVDVVPVEVRVAMLIP